MNELVDLMRIDEAAEFLAISKGTLYHWVSEKRVPVIKPSRRCIRFRRSDLERWLEDSAAPESEK
jgi:excisionase family DNA binding protein